jgi:Predicted lipoprotein of unknown function (DUF2380)
MDLAPFRSYDPAIGRWWQADPIAKAWESPYAAMYNSPLNWADPMGLDPEVPERPKAPKGYRYDKDGNLMPKKTFEVTAKRENNRTLPSNLFIDGDQAYYQRGNTWYVQEHAPIEEGGTRTYGLDPRHGWVFVRSDYESYKGYVKAADNLVTAMEIVDAVGISVGLSGYGAAGAGLTMAPNAMSRFLAVGARYAPRAGGAAYGAKSARDVISNNASQTFKSFTKSNFRHNLKVATGQNGDGMDAHHIYPQASRFQAHWNRVGLNIHHPKNMTWWKNGPHQSASGAYNRAWDAFFRRNSSPSLKQIQDFGKQLMKSYGF